MVENGKTCKKCGEFKGLGEFTRHKGMKDGHINECKDCVNERVKEHRINNLERVRERRKEYYQKNVEHYRERSKEYSKEYYQKNVEQVKERLKDYFQTERGKQIRYDAIAKRSKRTKDVGGDFLTKIKKEIFIRDKGVCQSCKKEASMSRGGGASFDHKIPVYWGGRSTLENGQLLCKSCNSSKSNKLIDEILSTLPNPDDNIVWEIMNDRFKEVLGLDS